MIPPEPEPEPPVPEPTADYTYESDIAFQDGPYTAHMYTALQTPEGEQASLSVRIGGVTTPLYHLAVTDVTAFDQVNYYFCNYARSIGILTSNATVGGTHPYYSYDSDNHSWVQAGTAEVLSCTPADLFSVVDSGDFVLEERAPSKSRGEFDESDLDDR